LSNNIEQYKKDFERLLKNADSVHQSFVYWCDKENYEEAVVNAYNGDKDKIKAHLDSIPDFTKVYQAWYSECLALIKQLLPDRLSDFIRYYEKPKGRKSVGFENYRIEDALQGLRITRGGYEVIADRSSAHSHLEQQIAILNSIKSRFDSSLYDIRQLVQADLFDSELDSSRELLKHKFNRGAGAIAGVVLEKHLYEVSVTRGIKVAKKHPTISDLNDLLKTSSVIDMPQWRFIQHLGDLRNLCDHNKQLEPTVEQVRDLIDGVAKVIKTIF